MNVKVADEALLRCDLEVPKCRWQAQGVEFETSLRLFSLGCYDIILGMDWLQSLGDMNVNWLQKRLSFNHHGKTVKLQGLVADTSSCQSLTTSELEALEEINAICHLVQLREVREAEDRVPYPSSIQDMLTEFAVLFEEPQGLPLVASLITRLLCCLALDQ
jgi:hypothetical protein